MSGLAYAGLGVLAAVILGGVAIWWAVRSARREGGAAEQAAGAKRVSERASQAASVRADVAGAGSADARKRLSEWTRE